MKLFKILYIFIKPKPLLTIGIAPTTCNHPIGPSNERPNNESIQQTESPAKNQFLVHADWDPFTCTTYFILSYTLCVFFFISQEYH